MKYNFLDWGLIREGGLFEGGGLIDHLRYCKSNENPADIITRFNDCDISKNMMWLHGPNFIKSLNVKVIEITPDDNSLIKDVYSEELLYGETMVNVISQPTIVWRNYGKCYFQTNYCMEKLW